MLHVLVARCTRSVSMCIISLCDAAVTVNARCCPPRTSPSLSLYIDLSLSLLLRIWHICCSVCACVCGASMITVRGGEVAKFCLVEEQRTTTTHWLLYKYHAHTHRHRHPRTRRASELKPINIETLCTRAHVSRKMKFVSAVKYVRTCARRVRGRPSSHTHTHGVFGHDAAHRSGARDAQQQRLGFI